MEKLTINNQEINFAQLIKQDNVQLRVPHYQRNYKWTKKQVEDLVTDLNGLVDGGHEKIPIHFMGSIIGHQINNGFNQIEPLLIIDGQQRVTTIFLALLACIETLSSTGNSKNEKEAASYMKKLILMDHSYAGKNSNLRLQVSRDDSEAMNNVVKAIHDGLALHMSEDHKFIPRQMTSKTASKRIEQNYKILRDWAAQELTGYDETRIIKLMQLLLTNLTFVYIGVQNSIDGPKIFDRLNSRGKPLTVAELVKNDIFSRIENPSPDEFEKFESSTWDPFHRKFQTEQIFQNYFHPYGLLHDPNLTKATAYNYLQKEWNKNNLAPEEIIKELSKYQNDYLDIAVGDKNLCGHDEKIVNAFKRLRDLGQPLTIYPFLIKLSYELRNGNETTKDASETLKVLESFLVRRQACGQEATGLDKIFKNLWRGQTALVEKNLDLSERVESVIKTYKSISWPDDKWFKEDFKTRPLYGSRITKFILLQYDASLEGESPSDDPAIEHILPQKIKGKKCWTKLFNTSNHGKYKDTIGNLTLITPELNSAKDVSNSCYAEKKNAYSRKSMWKITREVSDDFSEWTTNSIQERADKISAWALNEWPHGGKR